MKRAFTTALTICLATSALASLWPEPETFHPNAPITWAVKNDLPQSLMVYETVKTNFSQSVLSNAMAIGSFRPINLTSQAKDLVVFEARQDTALIRSLKISSTQGSIDYFKSSTNVSSVHGVPSVEQTEKLAMDYLRKLGGDTNQVAAHIKPRIMEGTVERYDKNWHLIMGKTVNTRGIIINRQLDGIQERGSSLTVNFGNDAQVNYLNLNWKIFKPVRACKTFNPDEILNWIKSGHAIILPAANGEQLIPAQAKTLTVTKATPVYVTRNVQGFVYPSADLEVVADFGNTNAATFYLECPILSTNMVDASAASEIQTSSAARKLIPKEVLNVLENADEFTLLSLDPEPWLKRTNNFYGFPILGKTQIKDPKQRQAILDALYSGISENGLEAMCFDPRHGIHAKLGNQTEDLLICFECGQIYFHGVSEGKLLVNGTPAATFNSVLSNAGVPLPHN